MSCDLAIVIADLGSGGAQWMVDNLVRRFNAEGIRLAVITLSSADSDHFQLPASVRRFALGMLGPSRSVAGRVARNFQRITAVRRAIRASAATVVLSFVAEMNVQTILAAVGLPVRVVISEVNDPSRQRLVQPWEWLRTTLYRRADVVTANSPIALQSLRAYVPAEKLAWGPNPLTLPAETAPLPARDGRKRLLLVARFERQKAHDVLLAAFARIAPQFADWRLQFVGEGREEAALRGLASRLGIAALVDWEGATRDVWPYYRAASLFVLPSRHEGTPNVLTEAMACGLPIVVSDAVVGAFQYVEDHVSARLVPSENAEALAATLAELMADDAQRARLGAAAKARIARESGAEAVNAWLSALQLSARAPAAPLAAAGGR